MIEHGLRGSLAVARLELRCIRRAVRTSVMALLALAGGGAAFLFYHHAALQHYSVGAYSGNVVPGRFLMAGYAACFLAPLLAGMVLLAFDHRQRDRTARVSEVLDARPVGNLAVFVGRLLALSAVMWLVCLVFAALLQAVGLAADRWLRFGPFDGWLGPVEPWSLLAFLFVDAPPALFLWGALVLFLASALRHRLAVVVVGWALLGGYLWLLLHVPLRLLPAVSMVSGFGAFASDMLPRALTAEAAAVRGAQVLLAGGLVALGAASCVRVDRARTPAWVGGLACVLAGGCAIALLAQSRIAGQQQRDAWLAAHIAQQDAPLANLVRLSADVTIDAARALRVDATLELALPVEPTAELVFSLNPGLRVQDVELNGQETPHRHEHGLLQVPWDAAPGEANATLRVVAAGLPDPRFAYLDSVVDPLSLGIADGHYRILGTEPMVFSEDYAVLLPGLKWLPTPGVNLEGGAGAAPVTAPDFHDLDLRLDAPAGWLAAAPGQREELEENGDRQRYRFRSASPVPMAGVVAGRFERYATKVAGVEVELLLHPGHRRNAEFFAKDARQLLALYLHARLTTAAGAGLRYPHKRFSFVEAPGRLRGFGGGWRLDTTLALPGIALLREYGLPSMRLAMHPAHMVMFFLPEDVSGGDPNIALWRSMTRFQAAAAGEHAPVLDFLMDRIAKSVVFSHWPSIFSAHHHDAAGAAGAGVELLHRMMGHGKAVDRELKAVAGRVAISPEFLASSLGDLRFADNPKAALDMLMFKGRILGSTLVAGWPPRGSAKVLREMLRRHRGGTYTLEDMRAAAGSVGAPLDSVVGEWWASADLPGFVVSDLDAYRLEDGPRGAPRYQLRLHLCNEGAAPGLAQLSCRGHESMQFCQGRAVAHVPPGVCMEVGQIADFPPASATFDTYLSRNGGGIQFPALSIDVERAVDAPPLQGAQDSEWRPPASADVVVDDLSPGFAVDDEAPRRWWLGAPELAWTRAETPGSWGRFARTAMWSKAGDGERSATFAARLPAPGRWRLHYHLPGTEFVELEGSISMLIREVQATHQFGRYEMTLVERLGAEQGADAGGPGEKHTPIEFDGGIAEAGWNYLGDFDLQSIDVSLVVTDRTDGEVVVADAIRWRPLDG